MPSNEEDQKRSEKSAETVDVRRRLERAGRPDECEACDCCWEPEYRHGCYRPTCPCYVAPDGEGR